MKGRIKLAACTSLRILLPVATSLIGILVVVHAVASNATSGSNLTVCPLGPPTCDFDKIQDALDSAVAGNTVFVEAGAYTEQITLTDGVDLLSTEGPTRTSIVATTGPAVTARNVTSSTVSGFAITSQSAMSPLIGIDILDSDIDLENLIVHDLHGADGSQLQPTGTPAVGIYISGSSHVSITRLTVMSISGGSAAESEALGGASIGVWINGGEVGIYATTVQTMTGGASGDDGLWYCEGGGPAIGLRAENNASILVDDSTFTDLEGGRGCSCYVCECGAGSAIGIEIFGGQLRLRDSTISRLSVTGSTYEPVRAVATYDTEKVILENNDVRFLGWKKWLWDQQVGKAPQSPWCFTSIEAVAISSQGDRKVLLSGNGISDVYATGEGRALGFQGVDITDVKFYRNSLVDLSGGFGTTSAGIDVTNVVSAILDGNEIGRVNGRDGVIAVYGQVVYDGGSVIGIRLLGSHYASVSNNVVWDMRGGRGCTFPFTCCYGGDGGDAIALQINSSRALAHNNTLIGSVAGPGGDESCSQAGEPGLSVGLLSSSSEAVINNIIAVHDIGILYSGMDSNLFDYNDLWQNLTDYDGIAPGANDLKVDPLFVDPNSGELHLQSPSSLIDAGDNANCPTTDQRGVSRPWDGDGDGSARCDIGAFEYDGPPPKRFYLPLIVRS